MKEVILRVSHTSKEFKNFKALNDVSVELEKGKIYGLVGKNGAGKTTLMRIISGLSFATSGEIELLGCKGKEYNKALSKIGILIETPSLNGRLTAKENLKIIKYIKGVKSKTIEDELIELVGLHHVEKKQVRDFSLGMRQRLGIAIALINDPELLILDEPINGLDPVGVVEIRNLIKHLCEKRGITILLSSHNLPELYSTATDYIFIDGGAIKQEITMKQLDERCSKYMFIESEEPQKVMDVLKQKLEIHNCVLKDNEGVKLYEMLDKPKEVLRALISENIIPTSFAVQGDTLEGYFLSLVEGKQNN